MATSLIPLKVQKRLVTYYVDTDTVYTAKVKKKVDALSNLSFTPTLSGYTFVGWREDTTASSSVLSSAIVGSSDITLYAVFSKTITLSYNGNSSTSGSTSSQTGTQYYNNGNYANPSFTLASNGFTRTHYTFSKWASGSTSGTQYSAGASVTLSADTTFYAIWTANACKIALRFYWNSSVDDGATYLTITDNVTGESLLSATYAYGSTYGTSHIGASATTYGGVVSLRYPASYRVQYTAVKTLYSNSALSTTGIAAGSYVNVYTTDYSNSDTNTTNTYYVAYTSLSL